ncbi:MAG: response regulator [Sulfuriferula sp.]
MDILDQTDATILVATDNITDAALVKKLLDDEFEKIFMSTAPDKAVKDFMRHPPDVLVLAFDALEKSQHYYLRLFRLSAAVHLQPHRTIILCNKDEVRQAYSLCRDGLFDDYILFWPMVHDALRLPMSVHLALRELTVLQNGGPTPADFAAQARHLAQLENLLDQQMIQGVQHIEDTGHAVEQAERGIDTAMDEFFRRMTQGELPDVVEVRNAKGLAHEIARIKEGEVRQNLRAVIESVQPLTQWADEFQQACVPHLESIRSLHAMAERVRPTVLVVDDDEFQHKIVSKILEDENYQLLFASGGVEALSILRKIRPDLILMDIMMPDMNGLEVMRQMKTVPRLADIPVIMITGKGEKNIVTESLKAGANNFMVKPFARDTLLGKVAKVLHGT